MIGIQIKKPLQPNEIPIFEDVPVFETKVVFEEKEHTGSFIKVGADGKPELDAKGNFITVIEKFTVNEPKLDENGNPVYVQVPVLDENGVQKTKKQQIGTKPNLAQNTLAKYAEASQWCNENRAYIIELDDCYEVRAIPEPTKEEIQAQIQKQLTDAVQRVLDNKAQELNYDDCLSVCSYIDTGVAKFDAEGKAFRAWRSAVWAKGYEILAQVQAGERDIPTEAELLSELPGLVIDYSEV